MALHNPQYIFGDFNPDEFNQFFVTPRSSDKNTRGLNLVLMKETPATVFKAH
uniref:Uncharacterized protein n=1 Tax=Microcebus murinus TaxID=30608 RepID=A0A8C5XXJ2_MICMU